MKNGNDPTPGNLTEEKESEMEEFIDYAKVIMGTLGHKVFVPYVETAAHSGDDISSDELSGEILHFVRKNINGTGRRTSDGFVIFKGSVLNPKIVKSCPKNAISYRERYASVIDDNNTLTEDILVSSPSAAASFLSGTSVSGNDVWQTEAGLSLKNLEAQEQ